MNFRGWREETSLRILPEEESKLRRGDPRPFSLPFTPPSPVVDPGRCNCNNFGVGVFDDCPTGPDLALAC